MGDSPLKPDDAFPDLTLPEKQTPLQLPAVTEFRPVPVSPWAVGDRVFAPWDSAFLYAGWIVEIQGDRALIDFDDGDEGWVFLEELRTFVVNAGQAVFCRRPSGLQYHAAVVREVHEQDVLVRFEDTGEEDRVSVAALRIPITVSGKGALATRVSAHLGFFKKVARHSRVLAPWHASTLFCGAVEQVRGNEALIRFDDGDRGWVLLEQLLPLEIPVGSRLLSRRQRGGTYFPATVTEVRGEDIHVLYDDGGADWTDPAGLCIPCQPFGPDARPSQPILSPAAGFGWVIWIGAAILMLMLRAGCR